MPPSAWESRPGEAEEPTLQDEWLAQPSPPTPRSAASGPRLELARFGMSPLKPLQAALLLSELFHYVPSGN